MKKCLFLLLFPMLSLSAQTRVWPEKIEPKLLEQLKNGGEAPFLVILKAQADLRPARRLRKKEDKGRYVYSTLSELAEQTQGPVRRVLREAGAYYNAFWVINALSSSGSSALVERLAQLPEVARVERDPVWRLNLVPASWQEQGATDRTLFPVSWGLTQINADDVWAMGFTGVGTVVGGQDTGYEWEHPAIKAKYRGWDGANVDHDYNWHDAIRDTIHAGSVNSCGLNLPAPCDDRGHGTHTMGTMAGASNDNNVIGVAPGAKWIGCRNMEEGDGKPSTYLECFQWFIAPTDGSNQNADPIKAPDVINNSWGCPVSEGCNTNNFAAMEMVVNNVRAAGIVVVVSAGNSGPGCSTVDDPSAIFTGAFSVGATQSNDNIANFSSRGPVTVYGNGTLVKPDVSAPGVSIYSCYGTDNNPGSYVYTSLNGTSMAGPHVAGLVALLISAKPALRGQVEAIETLLKNTAVPRYATAPFCGGDAAGIRPNNVYGYGRINALPAIVSALPIELLAFEAKRVDGKAQLRWTTATELDCANFEIQRSCDGLGWETIGRMACKGTDNGESTDYLFDDEKPCKGLNYYRLQQNDFSGQTSQSQSLALSFAPSGYSLRLTGQPGTGAVYVEITGADAEEKNWLLQFYAADGRLVQSATVGASGWLGLPDLPGGVYAAVLVDENGRAVAVERLAN